MLFLNNLQIVKILPILKINLYRTEMSFFFQTYMFKSVILILKNHFNYQFKVLTCISGVDYPNNLFRFTLVYDLLSIKYNCRLRLKILLNEITPANSIEQIIPSAYWWECEIWDMFGVFFLGELETIRLLTDYGFNGYPLRKDFPLSGYLELKYSTTKNRVVYEHIELAQEYRAFDFTSPWQDNPENF